MIYFTAICFFFCNNSHLHICWICCCYNPKTFFAILHFFEGIRIYSSSHNKHWQLILAHEISPILPQALQDFLDILKKYVDSPAPRTTNIDNLFWSMRHRPVSTGITKIRRCAHSRCTSFKWVGAFRICATFHNEYFLLYLTAFVLLSAICFEDLLIQFTTSSQLLINFTTILEVFHKLSDLQKIWFS